jgi:hypothetical protein
MLATTSSVPCAGTETPELIDMAELARRMRYQHHYLVIRPPARQARTLRRGDRIGALVVLSADTSDWWLDHASLGGLATRELPDNRETRMLLQIRPTCMSPRCIRCNPDTAIAYVTGTVTVLCNCGNIAVKDVVRVASGDVRTCGRTGWLVSNDMSQMAVA